MDVFAGQIVGDCLGQLLSSLAATCMALFEEGLGKYTSITVNDTEN